MEWKTGQPMAPDEVFVVRLLALSLGVFLSIAFAMTQLPGPFGFAWIVVCMGAGFIACFSVGFLIGREPADGEWAGLTPEQFTQSTEQFAQAIAMGKISGDELRSIVEGLRKGGSYAGD